MVLHLSSDPRLLKLQTYITHEMLGLFDPGMKQECTKKYTITLRSELYLNSLKCARA